jgi:hypothetical protein
MHKPLFEVNVKGLKALCARRSKSFILFELYQNARDEGAHDINVELQPVLRRPGLWRLRVEDDVPTGFQRLSDAWTLFAPSLKAPDAAKAGLFNLGEKLVIAYCQQATIETTTGTVEFGPKGRRVLAPRRKVGSCFTGLLKLTQAEAQEMSASFATLLITKTGCRVQYNGLVVSHRSPIWIGAAELLMKIALPCPVAESVGQDVKVVSRTALVQCYEPLSGETPSLYEHGIPVCPNDGKWHYNVMQRVPVPFDRDVVPASYLRKLHVAILNAFHTRLVAKDTEEGWVKAAVASPDASPEAVVTWKKLKYGENAVMYDPSDKEANNRAVAEGYRVIYGGSEPAGVHENIRRGNLARPAGQVFPTPKPFGNGPPAEYLGEDQLTHGMKRVRDFARKLADVLLHIQLSVEFCTSRNGCGACYGHKRLTFFVENLGRGWFDDVPFNSRVTSLILHELAHEIESNHLDASYHRACCQLGADLACRVQATPSVFAGFTT